MVIKRKPSVHGVCEPKKKVVPSKPPSKADLLQEIKTLKSLNDSLEEEMKKMAETIEALEDKVAHKNDKRESKVCISSQVQTYSETTQVPCNICIFVATCEEELNWHMGEEHNLPTDSYFDSDYPCDISPVLASS